MRDDAVEFPCRFLYGDYDASAGRGVIVLEDFCPTYSVEDPHLMLLEPGRVREVVSGLATLHGICVAHRTTEPRPIEALFPLLDDEEGGAAFFQDDMKHFLHEMYATCRDFLQVQ